MNTKKSTHSEYRTELFAPIMKEKGGKYIAVLSDDSVDRDEEKLSSDCVRKLGSDDGYLAALCNHNNDVFMQVAEWTDRGVTEIDGHTALIAEPKFYKSNPNSKIISGMLDEGAQLGVSIGAMVKDYDEIDGMRIFTEMELLEASFVAVPSNRHGRAMAVAKSYNKSEEEIKVSQLTQKDIDSAVEKKAEELNKLLAEKDEEISKLKKAAEEKDKSIKETQDKAESLEKEKEALDEKVKEAENKAEEEKKKALEKQKFADQGGDQGSQNIDVEKEFSEGKLPIMRGV